MKKYCSLCRQPLSKNDSAVCDKCGKPTDPISVFDIMATDNCLSSKEKRGLELIGILNIIAGVISLVEWIILLVAFGDIRSTVSMLMTDPNAQLTAEEMASYQSTVVVCNLFAVIGVIAIILVVASIVLGVLLFLKNVWAVKAAFVLYIINIVVNVLSGNLLSAAITVYILVKLSDIMSKMAGGAEYTEKSERIAKEEAALAVDPTKWRCKGCGYINHIAASECKSCGKWKQ